MSPMWPMRKALPPNVPSPPPMPASISSRQTSRMRSPSMPSAVRMVVTPIERSAGTRALISSAPAPAPTAIAFPVAAARTRRRSHTRPAHPPNRAANHPPRHTTNRRGSGPHRALGRYQGVDLQPAGPGPPVDRLPGGGRQDPMPLEHPLQPFLEQRRQSLAQAEDQQLRGGAAERAVAAAAHARRPVPVAALPHRAPVRRDRLVVGGDEAEARCHHQPLLRGGDGDVDAPLVHPDRK